MCIPVYSTMEAIFLHVLIAKHDTGQTGLTSAKCTDDQFRVLATEAQKKAY